MVLIFFSAGPADESGAVKFCWMPSAFAQATREGVTGVNSITVSFELGHFLAGAGLPDLQIFFGVLNLIVFVLTKPDFSPGVWSYSLEKPPVAKSTLWERA